MNDCIVTIGRQNGSGGREVGHILSQMMGIPCYDREIIEKTARMSGMTAEAVEESEESPRGARLFFHGISPTNPLYAIQSETISELASRGPCIFVGRCADHVLRGRPGVVNVFVDAPVGVRIKRSAERNGISEKEAYRRITEKDEERAAYYQRCTGRVWGSVSNYHISVNTGPIGVENAARLILEYISMME